MAIAILEGSAPNGALLREGIIVRKNLHWLIVLGLTILLLAACTRNRPIPEPTVAALPVEPVSGGAVGADPVVTTVAITTTETTAPGDTATPAQPGTAQTFEYRVLSGETLSAIATKFETDVETIRKLNFLIDDNIFEGQILQVPYQEGMTEAGAPTPTPEPYRYTVQVGDTMGSIELKFNTSSLAIIEANGILDPNSLVVGQEILIPGYTPPEASPETASTDGAISEPATVAGEMSVVHIVQPGEGLLQIARSYGVDASAIAEANNITNRNLLRAGQRLVIPGITTQQAAEARGTTHVVQAGESLLSIATRYGVTVDSILTINELPDPNQIYVGQELLIPTE
jgi:LysM repeat protein